MGRQGGNSPCWVPVTARFNALLACPSPQNPSSSEVTITVDVLPCIHKSHGENQVGKCITVIFLHQNSTAHLFQVILQLSQDHLQLIDFARQCGRRSIAEDRDRVISLNMKPSVLCEVFVSDLELNSPRLQRGSLRGRHTSGELAGDLQRFGSLHVRHGAERGHALVWTQAHIRQTQIRTHMMCSQCHNDK